MKQKAYAVIIHLEIVDPNGDHIEYSDERFYRPTLDEAYAEADRYKVGDVAFEYEDGAECIVTEVYVDTEPTWIESF